MDKRTTIRRLETLATFLETKVPAEHFDMGSFFSANSDYTPANKLGECGATACALGWAARIPSFNRAGLTVTSLGWPYFGTENGLGAGAQFFGITEDDSCNLFGLVPGTPKQVAKRIRKFVAELRAA
jgi:hypothetical protein